MNQLVSDYYVTRPNADMQNYLYQPLADFSANSGKRHRPLVTELACLAVGGNADQARSAASAIEHFHTAALIHDDIADDSLLRRGKPCLHLTIGVGLAINTGDLALSQVTGRVLEDENMSDSMKVRVLDELVKMTTRTIEGQALDIGWARDERFDITIEDYLLMATHKTAFYSGGTPLAVGAIVGGASDEQVEALRAFGIATGLAFQIQDDLLNLIGEPSTTKKDFRNDITEGKRTMMVVHAILSSPDAAELVTILKAKTDNLDQLARAVEIMQDSGSLDFARNHARAIVSQAKAELSANLPTGKHLDLLLSMADYFIERMN
ncbi:MAG: polyprenyl synthetase family protein [Coriobacteriia bacterium]|nr:polyprenyl synthetase family protein [Coriobacteriia bacterium]